MGIPHQAKNCKRIIISSLFIFSVMFMGKVALAYDSIFVVEDVSVDVTAKNSVEAQDQAFDVAQNKAFRILAQRMVDDAQAAALPMPDPITVSSLIKDYEVTNEQLSAVRYIGTYTFRFREKAVSEYFSVSGVSFTETGSKTLMVLPVFQKDGKNSIWSEDNIWMHAWGAAELSRGLVPVEVPIGDLMDISDIDDHNALSYSRSNLDRMLARYGASEAAVMIAVPDMMLIAVNEDSEIAKGRLRISIYRTDRATAEHVKDIHVEADGTETREALYNRAVLNAYKALQTDWKSKTLASLAQSQSYDVRAQFKTLKQWATIQQALSGVAGLSDLSVRSVKRSEAHISFIFRGDEQHLRDALRQSALKMGDGYANSNANDFTEQGRAAPPLIYDLIMGQVDAPNNFYQGREVQEVEPAAGEAQNVDSGIHTF